MSIVSQGQNVLFFCNMDLERFVFNQSVTVFCTYDWVLFLCIVIIDRILVCAMMLINLCCYKVFRTKIHQPSCVVIKVT